MAKKQDDNQIVDESNSASEEATLDREPASAVTQEDFDKVKGELEGTQNQLKRAVADYQNLEKRVAEGRAELASWATGELLKKIIPVMGYFDQAMKGVTEEERKSGWFKGVDIALQQLRNVLLGEGLEEIETDGQFDPALHEAVDTREGEDGKILETVDRGYTLNGKIIRPAKVIVGKN